MKNRLDFGILDFIKGGIGMKDIFGKEIEPGDLIGYMSAMETISHMVYGIYTSYDTVLVWCPYIYSNQDMLSIGNMIDDNLYEAKLDSLEGCYKVQNFNKYEQALYDSMYKIYANRMKGIEKYNNSRRKLQVGDVIVSRISNSNNAYLYLGKVSGYQLHEFTKENKVGRAINEQLYYEGKYLYYSLGGSMRLNGFSLKEITCEQNVAKLFKISHGLPLTSYYSLDALKTPKNNCWYYTHLNLGSFYNRELDVIYLTYKYRDNNDILLQLKIDKPGVRNVAYKGDKK